jgi:hypothetical protein
VDAESKLQGVRPDELYGLAREEQQTAGRSHSWAVSGSKDAAQDQPANGNEEDGSEGRQNNDAGGDAVAETPRSVVALYAFAQFYY